MINNIITKGIFNKRILEDKPLFYLKTPIKFRIGRDIIETLRKNYLKDKEIGGYIYFGIVDNLDEVILEANKIVFIENQSDTPQRSYVINTPEHEKAEKVAFENDFIPFRFHTHPTSGSHELVELKRYLKQLNTSLADKYQSFNNIHRSEDNHLILPDILIVDNSFALGGMFIGFYNGLVMPNNFDGEKNKANQELAQKSIEVATNFWERSSTTAKWTIGGSLLAVAALIFRKKEYAIVVLIILAIFLAQMPLVVREKNRYFGMTKGEEIDIEIPDLDEEDIMNNINSFSKIKEQKKKHNAVLKNKKPVLL